MSSDQALKQHSTSTSQFMSKNRHNHRGHNRRRAAGRREVEFTLESAHARSVHLAGDFTQWAVNSLPLQHESPGRWRVRVPLDPGPHQYRFIVDGEWQCDPRARDYVPNPFGSCNCVVVVQ